MGDRIHADLIGPITPESVEGFRYALMVVDDATRYKWIRFLKTKTADEVLQRIVNILSTRFDKRIKAFHVDGGTEFSATLKRLEEQGTEIRVTPAYTQSSNGLAERWNGLISQRARAMIHDPGVPHTFWPHAYETAVHISNRLPCSSNAGGITPLEAAFGIRPTVAHFIAFGAEVSVVIPEPKRVKSEKIAVRIIGGVFLGYQGDTLYKVYIPSENRIVNPRFVRVDPNVED